MTMTSSSESASGEGDSPDVRRGSSPERRAIAIPLTESGTSTHATTMNIPSDAAEAQQLSMSTEDDPDNCGADTPQKLDTNLELMGSQFQKLQAKVAQLEQQADSDRRERQALEQRVSDEAVPLVLANYLTGQLPQNLIRRLVRSLPPRDARRFARYIEDPESSEDDDEGHRFDDEELFARLRGYDNNGSRAGSKYTSNAIHLFEQELRSLYKEERKARTIRDDRSRLQTMEEIWQAEREDLLQQQRELQQLRRGPEATMGRLSEEAGAEEDNSSDIVSTKSMAEPISQKAEINIVNWQTFIMAQIMGPSSFAIDVLKGDPEFNWKLPRRMRLPGGYLGATEEKAKPRKTATSAKSPLVPGQAPVPERIRINSTHILKILGEIDGDFDSNYDSLVMIRPYKALIYYEDSIRFKLRELEAKFCLDEAGSEDVATADPPEGTNASNYLAAEATDTTAAEDGVPEETTAAEDINGANAKEGECENEFTSSLTAYQHLKCLVSFMDDQLRSKIAYLSSDRCQTVSFSDIWYLFKPGDEVIEQSRRQVYRIMSVYSAPHQVFSPYRTRWDKKERAEEDTPVVLNCVYLDFDGKELGPMLRKVRIARFVGEKAVTSLEVYPLRFAEERRFANELQDTTEIKEPKELRLREKLIVRGRMFMAVTNFKHMHYSGLTLDTLDEVDSHVVVDFEEAFSHAPRKNAGSSGNDSGPEDPASNTAEQDWRPALNIMIGQEAEEFDGDCTAACCSSTKDTIHKDEYAEKKRNEEYMATLMPEDRQREPPPTIYPRPIAEIKGQGNMLRDADLLIMSYRVFGFILRSRKWAKLDLTNLTLPVNAVGGTVDEEMDVARTESQTKTEKVGNSPQGAGDKQADAVASDKRQEEKTAFAQLVLPSGHKEMVKSLIAQHFRDKESASSESREAQQVDIVRGKGKGLIILLHGAPGVGKTTTAEGVAEMFKKPLFQVTCGDLGTSAPEVEKALETHFSLANRWGCVLLLDEADVFLAARSKEDFKRNGLVSVFLRVLEYYAGILFLTTNRVGDFDEAFASRIHISLYYPQLDLDNTRAIFQLNLGIIKDRFKKKGRKIQIEEEEILESAKTYYISRKEERWNGRQIRNACQTALALAEYRAQGNSYLNAVNPDVEVQLTVKDLQFVSDAYLQFMHHLNKIRGKNAEMWAKGMKLRAREIDVLFMDKTKEQATKEKEEHAAVQSPTGLQQPPMQASAAAPTTGIPARAAPATPEPSANVFSALPAVGQGAPPGPPMGQHYGPQGYYQPWYGQYGPPGNTGYPPPAGLQSDQQQWVNWQQQAQQGPAPVGVFAPPPTVPSR